MPLDLGSMNLEERTKYLELKEQYKKKLLPWYKKWWGRLIIIILGLFIIFATITGLYIYNEYQRIKTENADSQKTSADAALQTAIYGPGTNYFMGPATAQLTIVEFSDFACPYCEQAHTILKKIVDRYPGKVKIVFRDMPLHENSVELALSARCAGEQGKFWEMHDQLFANQSNLTGTSTELTNVIDGLAGTIGVNPATFDNCYSTKKYLNDINTDFSDGNSLNLKGTPSWFLNGKLLTGYLPEADYFTLLDSYFANQANQN